MTLSKALVLDNSDRITYRLPYKTFVNARIEILFQPTHG